MNSKKINIALPTSTFLPNFGGVEVGLHNIARILKSSGQNPVIICSSKHKKALEAKLINLPYKIESYPRYLGRLLKYFPFLAFITSRYEFSKLQKKYSFDIWHCTSAYPAGVLVADFVKKKRIPAILRTVGSDIQIDNEINYGSRLNPRIDILIRNSLLKFDKLIATTKTIENEYHKINIPSEKIAKITNGVDIEKFTERDTNRSVVRTKYNISDEDFVFLCVGRNHVKKGFNYLVQSTLELAELTEKKFKVVIVGKGVNQLKDLIEESKRKYFILIETLEFNVNNNSNFSLPNDDLIDLYKISDTFVFPSLIESFGIVLVEAMAAGLPIITTTAPGCDDLIVNGRNGIKVAPADKNELKDVMFAFLNRSFDLDLFRKNNLNDSQHYSWVKIVDQYIKLYSQIFVKE